MTTIGLGRKKVYKYTFDVGIQQSFEVLLPIKSQIISVQPQHGQVAMWYTFDPDNSTNLTPHNFRFIVTGDETVSIVAVHIATIQFFEGNLVLHMFKE